MFEKIDTKTKLSVLWVVVMINMIYADIFSIIIELVNKNTLDIPGEVKTVMAIAAIVTNIPIMMIFLSRVLAYKVNRIVNVVAAILTIIYVIGGGDLAPHYLIIASIEITLLILIIVVSLKWQKSAGE
jgi:hypothetical protein